MTDRDGYFDRTDMTPSSVRRGPGRPRKPPVLTALPRVPGQERFDPPDDMPGDQRVIWNRIMSACPAGWFGPENLHLLKLLCVQQAAADVISIEVSANPTRAAALLPQLDKLSAAIMKLSHQLRLTQKSRYEGKYTLRPEQQHAKRPWED